MAHNSPETIARLAARSGFTRPPLIGQGRQPTDAELAKADRDYQDNLVLEAITEEQKLRDHIVRLMLSREDFDVDGFCANAEAGAKTLLDAADTLVRESNRRDYEQVLAELRRLGQPVARGLKLICDRHGIVVPAAEEKPIGRPDPAAPPVIVGNFKAG